MNFEPWQISKIRRGIQNYRLLKRLSWNALASEIMNCPVPRVDIDPEADHQELHHEALRRFANGESKLHDDKINDIKVFLIYEEVFSEEDFLDQLQESGERLAVYRGLANDSEKAMRLLSEMPHEFFFERAGAYGFVEQIRLNFYPEEWGAVCRVQEQFELRRSVMRSTLIKDGGILRTKRRNGYAFLSTQFDILHVFLHGAKRDDRIHYFELRTIPVFKPTDSLFLARSGEAAVDQAVVSRGAVTFADFNICIFRSGEEFPQASPSNRRRS